MNYTFRGFSQESSGLAGGVLFDNDNNVCHLFGEDGSTVPVETKNMSRTEFDIIYSISNDDITHSSSFELEIRTANDIKDVCDGFILHVAEIIGVLVLIRYKTISEDSEIDHFYSEYSKLSGRAERNVYAANLAVFFAITKEAYTGGGALGSRDFCYKKWVNFVGDKAEASRYFNSVDKVASYT